MPTDPTALPVLDTFTGAAAPVRGPVDAPSAAEADPPRRAWVEQIMGMPISIHLRGPGCRDATDPVVAAAVAAVFAELREVEARFSVFREDSEISRLRRGELALADCHPEVREVTELCERAREDTDGWFDADLPLPDGGRAFDPTGLVKGWAVERAARHLVSLDGHDHLVNAGGDLTLGCRRTDTQAWQVGIENPLDRDRMLLILPLRTGAVATSGTAARGRHILDPGTGEAVARLAAVTVIGPLLTWADVYATAAFARGPDSRDWLAGLTDHAALLVSTDGQVTTTT